MSPPSEVALPRGWTMVPFGEMAQSINDRVDNPAEAGVERYVGLEHLDPGTLHLHRWGLPTDVEATKLRFKPGDVIFGRRRAYQRKLAVADFEGICSAHALVLRARAEAVEPAFLPVFMQSELFFKRALEISVGSLSPTINWKTLAIQRFPLPPKEEQRRLADILWAADAAVERWREAGRRIDEAEQAVLSEITTLLLAGNSRDWPATTLELAGDPTAPIRYGIVQVGLNDPGGVPTIAIKDLGGSYDALHRTNRVKEAQYANSRVTAGDVLLSIKGTIGRCDVVPQGFDGNISRDVARIRLAPAMRPRFLVNILRSRRYQDFIERQSVGSTRREISIHRLRKFPVPIPRPEEQDRFLRKTDALEVSKRAVDSLLKATDSLRHQLREDLLGGGHV